MEPSLRAAIPPEQSVSERAKVRLPGPRLVLVLVRPQLWGRPPEQGPEQQQKPPAPAPERVQAQPQQRLALERGYCLEAWAAAAAAHHRLQPSGSPAQP
jgi:hypothetical protein